MQLSQLKWVRQLKEVSTVTARLCIAVNQQILIQWFAKRIVQQFLQNSSQPWRVQLTIEQFIYCHLGRMSIHQKLKKSLCGEIFLIPSTLISAMQHWMVLMQWIFWTLSGTTLNSLKEFREELIRLLISADLHLLDLLQVQLSII